MAQHSVMSQEIQVASCKSGEHDAYGVCRSQRIGIVH